ncbi:MAG: 30S ribosomal protein S17 [Candidatus Pacebacteria bacterium]|nr:30S ribosomal protein S17 [Candidatus Paceibacterota bacterium]
MNISKVQKRQLSGVITSAKMALTAVVEVTRLKQHPLYHKYYKTSKRYKAHNPDNKFQPGDKVIIEETRPISKDKS